ncbi:MAG: ATP-binding cassette subfamily C protein [Alcanivorax sp.]|jgi:ATP-binding cassette subfamily C protein
MRESTQHRSADIKLLISLLTPVERKQVLWQGMAMVCIMLLELVGIGLLIPLVAVLFGGGDELAAYVDSYAVIGALSQQQLGIATISLFMVFYIVKVLILLKIAAAQEVFPEQFAIRLSQQIFRYFLTLDLKSRSRAHKAVERQQIIEYPSTVARSYLIALIRLTSEGLVVAGILIFALILRPTVTLTLLIFLTVLLGLIHIIDKTKVITMTRAYHRAQRSRDLVVDNALAGITELKLYQAEDFFAEQYSQESIRFGSAMAGYRAIASRPRLLVELGVVAAVSLVLLAMLLTGSGGPDIVIIALFGGAGMRMLPSLTRISQALQAIDFGSYALRELAPVMAAIHEQQKLDRRSFDRSKLVQQSLKISGMRFQYDDGDTPVFEDIRLTLTSGDTLGIRGRSGSGKSTLARALAGLIAADIESITVDGQHLAGSLELADYAIGYVPQRVYIAGASILENIVFGGRAAALDQTLLQQVIAQSELTSLVKTLPSGLDSMVGEHQASLSGGEMQRIGIARALYRQPSVLILDEATSALEESLEKTVIDNCRASSSVKIMVVISHRSSSLALCSRVIDLD